MAPLFLTASIIRKNILLEKLYYDLYVPYRALGCMKKETDEYYAILNAIDEACLYLDFRHPYSKEFYEGARRAEEFVSEEFYGKVCGKDAYGEIALIGHTHIDVAWLWTLAQTEEKAQRSFSTVIQLMDQYPEYIFMSSQPQLYEYVKKNDPELYEKIKERIKEGRWEVEGAMWLEADTNLASGESLIRQILYGKKFMREEFGHENHTLWLPDVFGYSAALPQILKKSGVDNFFTCKISWCETDNFPHDNFIWQGIDGTEVFALLSESYVKQLDPDTILASHQKHVDKKYSAPHISTFGYGVGGGGPTKEMLENYDRLKYGFPGFPKVTMKKAQDTIEEVKAQFSESTKRVRFTPKWVGELYLEMHRGTYTTMAHNKMMNRRCEFLYEKAETAAVTAKQLAGAAYPADEIEDAWHTILKNQFHDIIPGSSIREVYEVSREEYAELAKRGNQLFENALGAITKDITTEGGTLVYNPTSYKLDGIVKAGDQFLNVHDLPAHGYAVLRDTAHSTQTVTATETTIENEYAKVTFDEAYRISSFYDKKAGREVLESGKPGNVLEVYEDYPRAYDAWEITEYYKQKMWEADDVSGVEIINEPLYAGIRVTRKYCDSLIKQTITLKADSARLDFDTEIDWHEEHVLLKAAFPLNVRATHMNCEIQFGHIERPTHRNTSWDQAKFEVCAHKWTDISEADYGAALLNDCKYGYSAEENILKLSLLKAPTNPNPVADRGHHRFTYALYPHQGSLAASDVVKESYILNLPVTAMEIAANAQGTLPETFGYVETSDERAVIETIKRAESGDGDIVRVYDSKNAKGDITLTFGFDIKEAYECDMQENELTPLTINGRTLTIPLSNFEIKTIEIKA